MELLDKTQTLESCGCSPSLPIMGCCGNFPTSGDWLSGGPPKPTQSSFLLTQSLPPLSLPHPHNYLKLPAKVFKPLSPPLPALPSSSPLLGIHPAAHNGKESRLRSVHWSLPIHYQHQETNCAPSSPITSGSYFPFLMNVVSYE